MSNRVPAIPPTDYTGSMSDWITGLTERGYDGANYWGIKIPEDDYDELLDWCEGGTE